MNADYGTVGISAMSCIRNALVLAVGLGTLALAAPPASAETILGALAKAYENNPDLNAARAGLRATDEDVPIAKSGYRPNVAATASLSATDTRTQILDTTTRDGSIGVSFTQTLFDGYQTRNNVRSAQAGVLGGRQDLTDTEMSILLSAAQSYADVVQDRQIVRVRQENLEFLREQRNAAQARFDVGEGTRTDIAQAQAELESARALLLSAQAQLKSSVAVYIQIVGAPPTNLQKPQPLSTLLPTSSTSAVEIGLREHPEILSAQYDVDAAAFSVKAEEGALLPQVSLTGSMTHSDSGTDTSTIEATLTVPLYLRGSTAAEVRQAKETLGQARILVDSARREVEQNILTFWALLEASNASIAANQAQVEAAQLALRGVVEERKVGQSTTLDVLETQSNVLSAQESLAESERDAVVNSYSLMSAIGRLTVSDLNLKVARYRPELHYRAVEDKWFGLRTVDGR